MRQALILTGSGGVWVCRVGEFTELRRLKLLPDGVQQLVEGHFHRGLQVTRVDQLTGQRSTWGHNKALWDSEAFRPKVQGEKKVY